MNQTNQTPKSFNPGDKVEVNGNKEGRVIRMYNCRIVEVRLWQGTRHVGDVCVDISDCKPL